MTHPADLGEIQDVDSIPAPDPKERLTCTDSAADNLVRARLAGAGLKEYATRAGNLHGEPVERVIGDLLTDLRHLCDALGDTGLHGQSFQDLVEQSHSHWAAEVRGGW